MQEISTIKKLTSVFLIGVLFIAITPVTLIHNLLSDHLDATIQHKHSDNPEISLGGTDCNIEGFVADRIFSVTFLNFGLSPKIILPGFNIDPESSFYFQHDSYSALRGPPALT